MSAAPAGDRGTGAVPAGSRAAGAAPAPAPRRRGVVRGALRAAALGFFPAVVGIQAGGLVWSRAGMPRHGGVLAALVAAAGFAATLWVLLRLLRSRRGRLALRVLVAAHVLFWSVRGWRATTFYGAGPVQGRAAVVWQGPPQAFAAGYGEAPFGADPADTLAGYGAGESRRVAWPWLAPGPLFHLSLAWMGAAGEGGAPHTPMFRAAEPATSFLGAKAVVIRPAEHGATLAICRLDVVMCDARFKAAVLDRVADLGIVEDTLHLCATHTHSGFGGFSRTCLACAIATDHYRASAFDRVVAAAAAAIRAAAKDAVPARIGFVRARDERADQRPILAKNRAQASDRDRVDREVQGIRLDAADGRRRIALLLAYAVHPTSERRQATRLSGDLVTRLESSAAIGAGAPVLFVNGAEGDVGPRVEVTRPGDPPSLDVAAFEAAVAGPLSARATDERLRLAASAVRRDLGTPRYLVPFDAVNPRSNVEDAAVRPFSSGFWNGVGNAFCLPVNALIWSAACPDVRLFATPRGAVGVVAGLADCVDTRVWPFFVVRLETEHGATALLGIPGEVTTAVGERLKESARFRGASRAIVLGLCDDHFAYVADADEHAQGTYEARSTLFGSDTAEHVFEALDAALDAAGFKPPSGDERK